MSYKSLAVITLSLSVVLGLSAAAFGQVAPVSGEVILENADGTKTKVGGALIEVYRTDIKAGFPSTKTDKNGRFVFAGVPYSGRFIFSVSAAGATPSAFPGIRAGQENIVLKLVPGDGRKLTEAEARSGAASAGNAGQMTEAEKKAREELIAKNAAIAANNEKIKNADEVARKSVEAGRDALKANDWDTAIARFGEGAAAVPDFVGSTPILLNGKMAALKGKGYAFYKEGASSPDPAVRKAKYEQANKLYDEALVAFKQAIEVIDKAEPSADAAETTRRNAMRSDLYALATELHRLKAVGNIDTTKTDDAQQVVMTYVGFETDLAKRVAALTALGDIMRLTFNYGKAVDAYRKVLELKPDHADVMGYLGLVLYVDGVSVEPADTAKLQEGLNFMQKYTELAPISPSDSAQLQELKNGIKEAVADLRTRNLTPQKIVMPTKKAAPAKRKTN